jgi:drug/metabolite transporter (DMT)-like permease
VSPPEFSLLLISLFTSVAGQFLLKMGSVKLAKVPSMNLFSLVFNIITIPELLLGLTCYSIGVIAYILLLTRVNLSVAAPAILVGYIFSVLLGYFILKESIPLLPIVGLGLIVRGVILVV